MTSWVAIAAVLLVPLFVSPAGDESFRLPKMLLLAAFGIVLTAILLIRWVRSRPVLLSRPVRTFLICVAGVFTLSLIFSTHPMSSVKSSLTVVSCIAVGIAALDYATRGATHRSLWFIIAPAVINSLLVMLQFFEIWNPFLGRTTDENQLHVLRRTGLQGNTNDLGGLLVFPILASLLLCRLTTGRARLFAISSAVLMLIATVIASSITSYIALLLSAVVLFASTSRRALLSSLGVLLLLATVGSSIPPVRDRASRLKTQMTQGGIDGLLSGRLIAFDAAMLAFREDPVTGVGPGRFSGEFFRYRNEAISRFGRTRYYEPSLTRNYAEVHNDYLQLLAETGVPGFTLFIVFMLFISRSAMRAMTRPGASQLLLLGVPGVVSLATLSLAHFPLQLSSNLVTYSFAFGMILGWSERETG